MTTSKLAIPAFLLFACSSAPKPTPCESELLGIVVECRARKLTECEGLTDEACPLIAECDKRIDEACE